MKEENTVFEVGMIVYDQVNYPNKKGEVVDTEPATDDDNYPIEVEFEGNYSSSNYTLDGRLDLEQIPTLSTKPYEIKLEGFEQKQQEIDFDKMWKKPKKSYKPQIEYCTNYPTQDLANAFEALRRLLFIMEYYNKGWQADWNNTQQIKYTIEYFQNQIWCDNYTTAKKILNFKSSEIRDKFLKEQKYLLEFVKHLI